ncbi:taurine transport system permease protein [Sanguibacter gelidistatuariae]|uniref:Taurine transport system permease protein n=1 Tax=Sanguibacter gelidistatuariae TaxID=1814289 RepID=A0A1G6H1B2_9MICO|nr:ABC transporter permease [Sanguibacter gelidistatuariae]SDB87705.1 taurine transport system permease protein [Sanguibacter gelidistatuariae]
MSTDLIWRRRIGDLALRLGAVAVFFGLWWFVTDRGVWSEIVVPKPSSVWERFIQSVTVHDDVRGLSGYFLWEHLWASAWRLIRGVGWAIVIGIPLGLLLATSRPVRVVLEPVISFIRSLPPLAYFSLLIIWFGIEDASKVWLLFLAALAPIALSVISGVEGVRTDWVEAARSLGASRLQVVGHTLLPAILPELFTGLRLSIGFAFSTIVAAETVDGIPGIGGLAWSTKKFLQTDVAIMCVLVIGVCAVGIDLLIRTLERRLVPWKGRV